MVGEVGVGCSNGPKDISKWRAGEMLKGDRELVNVYLLGLRLGKE